MNFLIKKTQFIKYFKEYSKLIQKNEQPILFEEPIFFVSYKSFNASKSE